MKLRTQRLLAIRKIIEQQNVSSQEEILEKLNTSGFRTTQATLSRDLKFMKVGKIPDDKRKYKYVLPQAVLEQSALLLGENFPINGFISIDFAWNLGVIKTRPGYASSVASAIDLMDTYEILGTIAGDDTILIIPRDNITKEDVMNVLARLIPDLV